MIKLAIVGYGNLGKGALKAIELANDIECVGVFTRRNPSELQISKVKTYHISELEKFKGKIDALVLCGGSATDLPQTTEIYLKDFNTVDSFDTHAKIPQYYQKLDKVAKENNKLCAISIGWDPGLFSIARMLFGAILPSGNDYTFWGKGVSQGHSDAIRRIDGVVNAIQYTVPKEEAVNLVKSGANPNLLAGDKHIRECYVAVKEGADKVRIEQEIKEMPNYFKGYQTIVNFVSEEEVKKMQQKLAHGGFVIRTGNTSEENKDILELNIKLDSNPEFTGSVLVAYARAIAKMAKEGIVGVKTVFDIPISYLSPMSNEKLIEKLL